MARKPNYNFERMERDRAKAQKTAAKAKAKNAAKAQGDGGAEESVARDDDSAPEPLA